MQKGCSKLPDESDGFLCNYKKQEGVQFKLHTFLLRNYKFDQKAKGASADPSKSYKSNDYPCLITYKKDSYSNTLVF